MSRISDNAALLEMAAAGSKDAEERLVKDNMGLVRSIAVRFSGRGQDVEDLIQIGMLGMLKAIRGYDKSFGTAFSTYAVPLITGEIKRFLRDDGLIKVSREAKRNNYALMKAKEEFLRVKGREPKLSELCEMCGMETADAVYAMEACSGTVSLQEKIGDDDSLSVEDICGEDSLGEVVEKIALSQALESLDEKSRSIIFMRYYKGMTQSEVASILGMTQVKVSRTEKKIITALRERMRCG